MTSNKHRPKVSIIDYDMGNLFSVHQACEKVGLYPVITNNKPDMADSDGMILPGVGAFGDAMKTLERYNLVNPIIEFIEQGKPFMGVCLGMQLLFTESDEFGSHLGLDIISGRVRRFPNYNSERRKIKVPHIGWNQVYNSNGTWDHSPLKDIHEGEYMYFVHSYYALPENKEDTLSVTDYEGFTFCSSIIHNNIFATQFHPEKSAHEGIKIYSDWAKLLI